MDRVKNRRVEELRTCHTAVNLHRPVSSSWKNWVSHHELCGQSLDPFHTQRVSAWTEKQDVRCHHSQTAWSHRVTLHTVNAVNCSIQTLIVTPMHHTCATATLTGQGAKREERSSGLDCWDAELSRFTAPMREIPGGRKCDGQQLAKLFLV